MNFRLVPKSVTLNDFERRNGLILRYFTLFGSFRVVLRKSGCSVRITKMLMGPHSRGRKG